jgi:hypothetical protein
LEKDLGKTLAAAAFTPEELERLNRETEGLLERASVDLEGLVERATALAPSLTAPAVKPARRPASPAKREANRRNALRSTGPKTPAGKATASGNACKHGLLSRAGVLVEGEDEGDFQAFGTALRTGLAPEGELEALLADRLVTCAWRLRRAGRVEVEHFDAGRWTWTGEKRDLGFAFSEDAANADTFSKLSRYETSLERSLFRALHELQRLQAVRAGERVPAPVAVDLEVSGASEGGF